MYKIDTSVPGYFITTYSVGVYMFLCYADRESTFVLSASSNSVFSMSDYTKTSANIVNTSLPSGAYTGDTYSIMIPRNVQFFLTTVVSDKLLKSNLETLGVIQ